MCEMTKKLTLLHDGNNFPFPILWKENIYPATDEIVFYPSLEGVVC